MRTFSDKAIIPRENRNQFANFLSDIQASTPGISSLTFTKETYKRTQILFRYTIVIDRWKDEKQLADEIQDKIKEGACRHGGI